MCFQKACNVYEVVIENALGVLLRGTELELCLWLKISLLLLFCGIYLLWVLVLFTVWFCDLTVGKNSRVRSFWRIFSRCSRLYRTQFRCFYGRVWLWHDYRADCHEDIVLTAYPHMPACEPQGSSVHICSCICALENGEIWKGQNIKSFICCYTADSMKWWY